MEVNKLAKYILLLIMLVSNSYASWRQGENKNETYESFNGRVISFDPPRRFYITYKLENGDVHTEYISNYCSVKSNILGMEVYVTKYINKHTKKVTYQVHHEKDYFCDYKGTKWK